MKNTEFIQGILPEETRHLAAIVPLMWEICVKKMPGGTGEPQLGVFSAPFLEEHPGVNVFASISLREGEEPVGYWVAVERALAIWLSLFNRSFLIASPDSGGVFDCEILSLPVLWETNIGHIALVVDQLKRIRQTQQRISVLSGNWSWQTFPLPKDEPETKRSGGRKRKSRRSSFLFDVQYALRLCRECFGVGTPPVILSDPGSPIPQESSVLIVPPDRLGGNSTILLLPQKEEWRYAAAVFASGLVHTFVFRHPMPSTVLGAWEAVVHFRLLIALWYPGFLWVCFEKAKQDDRDSPLADIAVSRAVTY